MENNKYILYIKTKCNNKCKCGYCLSLNDAYKRWYYNIKIHNKKKNSNRLHE